MNTLRTALVQAAGGSSEVVAVEDVPGAVKRIQGECQERSRRTGGWVEGDGKDKGSGRGPPPGRVVTSGQPGVRRA